jgi:hypothetical protein
MRKHSGISANDNYSGFYLLEIGQVWVQSEKLSLSGARKSDRSFSFVQEKYGYRFSITTSVKPVSIYNSPRGNDPRICLRSFLPKQDSAFA